MSRFLVPKVEGLESRMPESPFHLLTTLSRKELVATRDIVEETMNDLLPLAMDVIGDLFTAYDPIPFNLDPAMFTDYALNQFQKRIGRLEAARTQSLDEIYRTTQQIIEAEDA